MKITGYRSRTTEITRHISTSGKPRSRAGSKGVLGLFLFWIKEIGPCVWAKFQRLRLESSIFTPWLLADSLGHLQGSHKVRAKLWPQFYTHHGIVTPRHVTELTQETTASFSPEATKFQTERNFLFWWLTSVPEKQPLQYYSSLGHVSVAFSIPVPSCCAVHSNVSRHSGSRCFVEHFLC